MTVLFAPFLVSLFGLGMCFNKLHKGAVSNPPNILPSCLYVSGLKIKKKKFMGCLPSSGRFLMESIKVTAFIKIVGAHQLDPNPSFLPMLRDRKLIVFRHKKTAILLLIAVVQVRVCSRYVVPIIVSVNVASPCFFIFFLECHYFQM